jgi:hypothetical protein
LSSFNRPTLPPFFFPSALSLLFDCGPALSTL